MAPRRRPARETPPQDGARIKSPAPLPRTMDVPVYVVDAFTDRAFRGNPAAVCLLDAPLDDAIRQEVAAEMRHSETAFLERLGPDHHRLRWFTPATEIDLCGHATLAAASVLFRHGHAAGDRLRFDSRSGPLYVDRVGADGRYRLDFPREDAVAAQADPALVAALGVRPVAAWKGPRSGKLLLELATPAEVVAARPDFHALRRLPGRGVVVTAAGGDGADFTSRYFHPWAGVDEDPVTGSAHTLLGPFWAGRLGKGVLSAHQASARGGRMTVEVRGERVWMTGDAVEVLSGTLHLPAAAATTRRLRAS